MPSATRFTPQAWKEASFDGRGGMVLDLSHRVLRKGMTVEECAELLGRERYAVSSWTYAIPQHEPRDPDQPIELVLVPGRSFRGAATLIYEEDGERREATATGEPRDGQLEAARAVLLGGGVERWCANSAGDRLDLAESVWAAMNYGWPKGADLDALHECGHAEYREWSIEVGPGAELFNVSQTLWLEFDGDRLERWGVTSKD